MSHTSQSDALSSTYRSQTVHILDTGQAQQQWQSILTPSGYQNIENIMKRKYRREVETLIYWTGGQLWRSFGKAQNYMEQ
jgi:hypothetical protein